MRLCDYSKKLIAVARVFHRWRALVATLDRSRRDKVARYADEIAATASRAADALAKLDANPADAAARRAALRELGRITGYLETVIGVLEQHLDGRKVAGVKRRLERLTPAGLAESRRGRKAASRIDRLFVAEGYFRALADSLRA